MTAGVYAIVNGSTERTYVGMSHDVPQRWREHRSALRRGVHKNRSLQSDWTEYGDRMFAFVMLERVSNPDERIVREQAHLDVAHQPYNASHRAGSGAKPGFKQSPEAVAKLSAALRGKPKSASHRAALSRVKAGKPCPAQSLAMKGRKPSQEAREKMRLAKLGTTQSAETRARRSASLMGRVFSEEWKHRISEAKKGRPWSASRRAAFMATGT